MPHLITFAVNAQMHYPLAALEVLHSQTTKLFAPNAVIKEGRLHNRYGRDLPLVNRVDTSYAFVEGWAHYYEQMMVETDFAAGKPRLRLTQLLEALVRNCRYMCSIWMHTQGMTVDAATRFFMDNAYMGEHPARHEAMRGTFDPGYLSYTLGKLMIL
jgi:uncharacterized protein (DUF885 family)